MKNSQKYGVRQMITKIIDNIFKERAAKRRSELYRDLIRHEAKIGSHVFGSIPNNHNREFFCLDEHTWVWHEEWIDQDGKHRIQTTRYEIRPNGVLKSQNGQYSMVTGRELRRFKDAATEYLHRVNREIYRGAIAV